MSESLLDESGLPQGYPFRDGWEVTPRQVKAMAEDGEDFVLLDCREPREYHVAHIAGSQLLPLSEAAERLSELEAYRGRKVVVHCHHGGRSLRMAAMLRQQGFEDVTSMAGGIDLWAIDIDSSLPRY